jgi:hypothetical protein
MATQGPGTGPTVAAANVAVGVTSTVKAGMDKAVGEFQAGVDQMAGKAKAAGEATSGSFVGAAHAIKGLSAPVKAFGTILNTVFKVTGILAVISSIGTLIASFQKAEEEARALRKEFDEMARSVGAAFDKIAKDALSELPEAQLFDKIKQIEAKRVELLNKVAEAGRSVSLDAAITARTEIEDEAKQARLRAEREYALELDKRRAKMVKDAEDDAYKQAMADAEHASNLATKEKQYRQELIDMFEEEDRRRLQAIEDRAEAERSAAQERARSLEDAAERIERLFDEKISVSINALGSQLDTIIARIGRRNP